ncbi:hypothetical protein SKTS_32910 [Sulfurimicrobium lacus]|uniref:Mu-like prophage FluMu protein gp29 n=1 Tax=Sulfurimicrobium lacus TaxID=2715678 RepID=A0A6F8VI11_9PROT|nr:DUF935 family protein [Sulfurimicrobium lacus]BCB28405.1 hypothetical protein SKTS_32910 [Sulfurimicrobium lacus]
MIKNIKAALARVSRAGLDVLQAGPRSTQGTSVNYMSVNTLDPSRLASAFAAADQGYITEQATLFELIEEQDPHIFSELAKRRRSVTGLGWQLTPPEDANQSEIDRTKELDDILRKIPRFEDAQYDLTDAIGKGLAPLQIDWQTGSTWYPKGLLFVPQRMFRIDRETGKLMYLKNSMPEPLREWGWVVHEHRAKSGYIESSALFRVLGWTYAYKAYNIRDMQRFLEMYGLPLRLGKYPAGIGDKQRDQLLKAVRNIGNDGAGVVPGNMTIDFIQAMKAGTVDDFLNATTYWERKQSMAILGGTLTSQADGKTSTNALGAIHDKVRREIMLHDVRQIAPTMNGQIVKPVALINGMFPENRLPVFEYQTEETVDQGKMVDVLDKAAGMGMQIDVDYAHKIMQIPKADKGATLLVSSGKAAAKPGPSDAALVRLAALAKGAAPDITSAYAAQLAALCAPHEQDLIQQIGAIVAEAGDFDEALAGIEALTANNPKWAEDMALGMAAADLAGRADVGAE